MNVGRTSKAAVYDFGAALIALLAAAIYAYASFAASFAFLGPPRPLGTGVQILVYAVSPTLLGSASILLARSLEASWPHSLATSAPAFLGVPLLAFAAVGPNGGPSRVLSVFAIVVLPALVTALTVLLKAGIDRAGLLAVVLAVAVLAVPLSSTSTFGGLFAGLALGVAGWVVLPAIAAALRFRPDHRTSNGP